ncbi:TonB-dependent receptor [Luteitalea sp. TBR-22]|uniref:TonB-dependent receptor n=1 Tax=Luteitalea sp. TBR-22 TaxID=2802971 RepID=UPI001AFA86EB|nr:TonB-dependent receptor [Luteitalea sp. TBR-22]BCS34908.1 TonB-dependent receptor [Luteitalea sp. TBR-22]
MVQTPYFPFVQATSRRHRAAFHVLSVLIVGISTLVGSEVGAQVANTDGGSAAPQASQAIAGATLPSITGVVRDTAGLPMPGVVARVLTEGGQGVGEAISDENGVFRIDVRRAGRYQVQVTLEGFEPVTRPVDASMGGIVSVDVALEPRMSEMVVVAARRMDEALQAAPMTGSVVEGEQLNDAGAFNVNRLRELVPTVQFFSTNPRNSSVSIRGLGLPFGLTNDGIEPAVGMYVDGVFFARSAAATLDLVDVERIEVLRGPQGAGFGRNTTAGAISVVSRRPSFTREFDAEVTAGSLGFAQVKSSVNVPLGARLSTRFAFSGTSRDGLLYNTTTRSGLNEMNNVGGRGQVLYAPTDGFAMVLAADHTRQRPQGFAQVVAGVAPTLRPANRQFPQIIADLNYTPPSYNAFDRLTDADTPHRSNQDLGGTSLTMEKRLGSAKLTSITAWRYWNWDPSNDRDFLGLPVTTVSANPSKQRQFTQEVRYTTPLTSKIAFSGGVFAFHQSIDSDGRQEHGSAAARFLLPPTQAALTPGLLDGYGQVADIQSSSTAAALFGQAEWSVTDRLTLIPGIRLNHDRKSLDYDSQVYGGLQTTDPVLIALQRSVLAPQQYAADVRDTNVTGQFTARYLLAGTTHVFGTVSTAVKPIGLNMNGVPVDSTGAPIVSAATVLPERVRHAEGGIKTEPWRGVRLNLSVFNTDVHDFQANVVNADVGVLRGYLANADLVRVRGVEFDGAAEITSAVSVFGAAAWTDARYARFTDAPAPLEETGGPLAKDISGSRLPGVPEWALTFGVEARRGATLFSQSGELFVAGDTSYRTEFSSSATPSLYLNVPAYALANLRAGYRWGNGWMVSVWCRNAFDTDYLELLSAAPGNSGLYVGMPGEPRTWGVTLRMALRSPGRP